MVRHSLFVDETYLALVGKNPADGASLREIMEEVVARWDAKALMLSEPVRQCAQIAMCQIALRWHPSDHYTYSFEDIARKLAEISPELKGKDMNARAMRDLLTLHHLSSFR